MNVWTLFAIFPLQKLAISVLQYSAPKMNDRVICGDSQYFWFNFTSHQNNLLQNGHLSMETLKKLTRIFNKIQVNLKKWVNLKMYLNFLCIFTRYNKFYGVLSSSHFIEDERAFKNALNDFQNILKMGKATQYNNWIHKTRSITTICGWSKNIQPKKPDGIICGWYFCFFCLRQNLFKFIK